MRSILVAALLAFGVGTAPAFAGKNKDGAMLVHTDDGVTYTALADYCASSLPAACAELLTATNKTPETEVAVIWFLAAFDPVTSPAVTTVQFGIQTNLPAGQGYVGPSAACGPGVAIELKDEGFPDVGRGNLVAYAPARTGHLWPFYWFAVSGKDGQTSEFGTTVYPGDGRAVFVDDQSPAHEDVITSFGIVRWGAAGSNSCPVYTPPPTGACCASWGDCVQGLDQETCEDPLGVYRGVYEGDGVECAGIVCAACCFARGDDAFSVRCMNMSEESCLNRFSFEGSGGLYRDPAWAGAGYLCTSSADSADVGWYCTTPTRRVSWGVVRTLFR